MRRVFIIHGFNVRDNGHATTDKLLGPLIDAGYDPVDFDYGYHDLVDVGMKSDEVIDQLASMVRQGDKFIAHSNGCALVASAIEKGAPFSSGVFIHPALRSDWHPTIDSKIKHIAVFSHLTDYATWAAGVLHLLRIGKILFGRHMWGCMGSTGYRGGDYRMINKKGAIGHSGGFVAIEKWAPIWISSL